MSLKRRKLRIELLGATVALCVLAAPICVRAQQAKEQWQRVYTGEDSIIEINTSGPRFEPGHVLRAEFRTVLSQPESIVGDPRVKFKTRLETIDFRFNDRRYRFLEIGLLDPNGKIIQKKTADGSEDWRVPKAGGITERLFNAACLLTPLGAWKVVAYRFAEGDVKGAKPTPELDRLIGAGVHLHFDRAEVGNKVCRSPAFEEKDYTPEELLRQFGIDSKALRIKADSARTTSVKCEGSGWQPPQSLLIREHKDEMLMLWEGVFLVLKRISGNESHNLMGPTLIRRQP